MALSNSSYANFNPVYSQKLWGILHDKQSSASEQIEALKIFFIENLYLDLTPLNYELSLDSFTNLAQALAKSPVNRLNFNFNTNMSIEAVEELASAFNEIKPLKGLNLSFCNLGDEKLKVFLESFKPNPLFVELDLQQNKLADEGVIALAAFITQDSSLLTLDLCNNPIELKGFKALGEALETNPNLMSLKLNSRAYKPKPKGDGLIILINALKQNKKLTSLDLSYFRSESQSQIIEALSEALKKNTTLGLLNLSHFKVKDKEAIILANGLSHNIGLRSLNLQENSLTPLGVESIAQALEQNTTLTYLNLKGSEIGGKGAQALIKMLSCNKMITRIDLDTSSIENASLMLYIKESLNTNRAYALQKSFELHSELFNTFPKSLAQIIERYAQVELPPAPFPHLPVPNNAPSNQISACANQTFFSKVSHLLYDFYDFIAKKLKSIFDYFRAKTQMSSREELHLINRPGQTAQIAEFNLERRNLTMIHLSKEASSPVLMQKLKKRVI